MSRHAPPRYFETGQRLEFVRPSLGRRNRRKNGPTHLLHSNKGTTVRTNRSKTKTIKHRARWVGARVRTTRLGETPMSAEEEVREHEEEEEATTTTTEVEVRVRRTTSTANKEGGVMHLDARARARVCVCTRTRDV
jgi:hypothetical protein